MTSDDWVGRKDLDLAGSIPLRPKKLSELLDEVHDRRNRIEPPSFERDPYVFSGVHGGGPRLITGERVAPGHLWIGEVPIFHNMGSGPTFRSYYDNPDLSAYPDDGPVIETTGYVVERDDEQAQRDRGTAEFGPSTRNTGDMD